MKCGWGLERNRNGGNAALAVLALPAVGGKFGVRGGGYSMSNSASWGIDRTWLHDAEPPTRVVNMNRVGRELLEPSGTPIRGLFVYNCNPAVTLPDQQRVLAGLAREDLFTVVFDQVLTDTAAYADVVLPATTFLEHYDFAKGYGPMSLQLARPVIEPVAEARPNADVFLDLASRLDLGAAGDPADELEQMLGVIAGLPAAVGEQVREHGAATPPFDGRPVQFVDVFPLTPDRKVALWPEAIAGDAPLGLYAFVPDPATAEHPLALISPASRSHGELHAGRTRPAARGARDASRRRRAARHRGRRRRPGLQRARDGGMRREGHAAGPSRHASRSPRACGGAIPATASRRTRWSPTP